MEEIPGRRACPRSSVLLRRGVETASAPHVASALSGRLSRMNTRGMAAPLFVNSPMCWHQLCRANLTFTKLEPEPSPAPTWAAQHVWRQTEATTARWTRMRRLGRRTGWLGWMVAGVLLVSAGGAALAAQGAAGTAQQGATTTTRVDRNKAKAGALGR